MEPLATDLLKDMAVTMMSNGGIGLSAIQVGIPKAFFMMLEDLEVVVNPVILTYMGTKTPMLEGCLSLPGQYETVLRYPEVEVSYWTHNFDKEVRKVIGGQAAHVFQHEYEHLKGMLFVDKLPAAKRSLIRGNLQKMKRNGK